MIRDVLGPPSHPIQYILGFCFESFAFFFLAVLDSLTPVTLKTECESGYSQTSLKKYGTVLGAVVAEHIIRALR